MADVLVESMVGGTIFHREMIQREISRVLVLNPLWQPKWCSRTAQDNYALDRSFALIEGHPASSRQRWHASLAYSPWGHLCSLASPSYFLLAAVIYDWISRNRVHKVYLWGGTAPVLSVPLRLAISTTPAWKSVAEFLTK